MPSCFKENFGVRVAVIIDCFEIYTETPSGDVILADRGFLIRDSVETLKGHLEIPAFTKGKNQLDPADIESTRPIPITMLSVSTEEISALDKILVVCSAFINLCPSVIPMD
ncbi:hypothetical protein NQ317_012968 [Molorchus minor]|uniref:DDE Tnp4 domain-containing protein n=1 Tax=Molorchus minor TaxID=1323400 RepID=A0ABQ9JFZ4_9CUCU|nr:hypothetical protein NQ317_012968 [Molorchus minor]